MSSIRSVARNTFWSAVETVATFVISIVAAVVVARVFGPKRLGYYSYLLWLTSITGALGSVGLVGTCRKYMGEYFGRGDRPMAWSIFRFTFRVQFLIVLAIILLFGCLALVLAPPDYKTIAVILVVSIAPRVLAFIPSGAHAAAEDNAANVPGSVAGALTQVVGTLLSIVAGWNLTGLALSVLAGYTVELLVKTVPVYRRFAGIHPAPIDRETRRRLYAFSGQGLLLMAFGLIVFDRIDLIFLEHLQPNQEQITFFSTSFALIDRLLLGANVFGGAVVSRMLAQYGADRSRLPALVGISGSYLLLIAMPLLVGAAAVAPMLIPLVYGQPYAPAAPVFVLMCLFAIPKVLLHPAQGVLQAHEQQKFLVVCSLICAVINIGLDLALIPRYAALGAAVGNGSAQMVYSLAVWVAAMKWHGIRLRGRLLMRNLLASAGMAAAAAFTTLAPLPRIPRLGAVFVASLAAYLLLVRWTRLLEEEDHQRLLSIEGMLPVRLRPAYRAMVGVMVVA